MRCKVPIYEYRCQQCNANFEQLVRSSKDKVKCPKCAGQRVRRMPSVFAMSGSSKDPVLSCESKNGGP